MTLRLLDDLTLALIVFLIFAFSGIIFRKIILQRLDKYVQRTPWLLDKAITGKLKRWIIPWFFLIGGLAGLKFLKLDWLGADLLQKILIIALAISVVFFVAEVFAEFVRSYIKRVEVEIVKVSIFEQFTKWIIVLFGVLIILYSLGIPIGPVLTGFGIGGLAVALALQDTLANFFSGVHILLSRQIRPGDYIRLDSGEEGYVVDITWRNTVIRELPNNLIIVPNSRISKAIIKNYYFPEKELSITIPVGVSYDSDLDKVEKVVIEVAKDVMVNVTGGVPEFEPVVRFHTLADFSINFNVILRVREFLDQYYVRHEFIKRLIARFREEGIVIPYPVRLIYMREVRDDKAMD